MAFDHYIRADGKSLRMGYTTGTCAALAAAGAAEGLLTGHIPKSLSLITPKGIEVSVIPVCCEADQYHQACCGVVKDAGDDKDVTDKLTILAKAQFPDHGEYAGVQSFGVSDLSGLKQDTVREEMSGDPGLEAHGKNRIRILGGKGVGRVTKPGLDQKVGEAAINSVPREMIRREVLRVCEEQGYDGDMTITIEVPGGEAAARKTLNERMGIIGGISIIGTSGIVEPMSMRAYSDSVRLLIRQTAENINSTCRKPTEETKEVDAGTDRRSAGKNGLILTPGNYGLNYLRQQGFDLMDIPVVVCSNFIGDALDEAVADGFSEILIVGHAGKLIKLAAGIMNTHSSMADGRLEIITSHAAMAGADTHICRELMDCAATDACFAILDEQEIRGQVIRSIIDKAQEYLSRRSPGVLCGMIMFSNEYGELGRSAEADRILQSWTKGMGPDKKYQNKSSIQNRRGGSWYIS